MLLLIKYTLLYGIVLMLVALGGMFSEHSGIINIALEGIMVIGGVAGVLTLTLLPAGMPVFLVVLISVLVAALAGFGAGLYYLSNVAQWNPLNSTSLPTMGFNGISVALLASSNPIGTIFSALFISHISVGGSFLSTKYYPTEISDLISGIIIYLCAFSMLFRGKIHGLLFKNADKTNVNAEPAPAKTETKKEGK